MPIYIVQVSTANLEGCEKIQEAQGFLAKTVNTVSRKSSILEGNISAFIAFVMLGIAYYQFKKGNYVVASVCAIAGLLSIDATISSMREHYAEKPRAKDIYLLRDTNIAETAIVGAYPNSLIDLIELPRHRQRRPASVATAIADARYKSMRRVYLDSVNNAINFKVKGTFSCFNRLNTFFMLSNEVGDRIAKINRLTVREDDAGIEKKYAARVNPSRDLRNSRHPLYKILYLVSDKPIDDVFTDGDSAIETPANSTLKLYEHIYDACDAYYSLRPSRQQTSRPSVAHHR